MRLTKQSAKSLTRQGPQKSEFLAYAAIMVITRRPIALEGQWRHREVRIFVYFLINKRQVPCHLKLCHTSICRCGHIGPRTSDGPALLGPRTFGAPRHGV